MRMCARMYVCVCVCSCVNGPLCVCRQRLYANVGEYSIPPEEDEDPYTYGDDTIYDSICYYQAPVR